MPISSTRVSGLVSKNIVSIGEIYTPHRDGAHIYNDMFELNLRGFLVEGSKFIELSLTDTDHLPQGLLSRMEKGK
jgi:hypothetical protein